MPFILLLSGSAPDSIYTRDAYAHERENLVQAAKSLNDAYKSEIIHQTKPDSNEFIDNYNFKDLAWKVKHPTVDDGARIRPLDERENRRLDEYLQDNEVLYPCVEFEIEYNKSSFLSIMGRFLVFGVIATIIVFLSLLTDHAVWWYIAYYLIFAIFAFQLIRQLWRYQTIQKKRLMDESNQEAYQLYLRRFVSDRVLQTGAAHELRHGRDGRPGAGDHSCADCGGGDSDDPGSGPLAERRQRFGEVFRFEGCGVYEDADLEEARDALKTAIEEKLR